MMHGIDVEVASGLFHVRPVAHHACHERLRTKHERDRKVKMLSEFDFPIRNAAGRQSGGRRGPHDQSSVGRNSKIPQTARARGSLIESRHQIMGPTRYRYNAVLVLQGYFIIVTSVPSFDLRKSRKCFSEFMQAQFFERLPTSQTRHLR